MMFLNSVASNENIWGIYSDLLHSIKYINACCRPSRGYVGYYSQLKEPTLHKIIFAFSQAYIARAHTFN